MENEERNERNERKLFMEIEELERKIERLQKACDEILSLIKPSADAVRLVFALGKPINQ
jgi:hypothetical protein